MTNFYKLLKEAKKNKMDPVDKDELKGDHEDREDKDIDNDGDADDSDEYLHNRRKAISKALDKKKSKVKDGENKTEIDEQFEKTLDEGSKKYTKPTEDEIKADLKKDQGKSDRMYGGMRGGLKKEEAEQIDEISKEKAADYHKKSVQFQKDALRSDDPKKLKKIGNRLIGVQMANKKMKEEAETEEQFDLVAELAKALKKDAKY